MDYDSLVIGGAGSKNFATIGALNVLYPYLVNIRRFLGVSSGSILATLLSIRCTPVEIKEYYDIVDLSQFKITYTNPLTYYKIIKYGGIHDSSKFREKVLHKILEKKTGNGNITFKQIFEKFGNVLVIPVSCLNKREMFYYNHISNPNMSVKFAIEQSSCVPGLFYPIRYKNDTIVDGGIIDNYPLYYFSNNITPNSKICRILPADIKISSKTIGILIIDDSVSKSDDDPYLGDDDTSSFFGYIKCLLNTLLTTNSRCRIGQGYWDNTLSIDIGAKMDGVSNMVLSDDLKINLFWRGEDSAKKFIKDKLDI